MGRNPGKMKEHVSERILYDYFENKATHSEKQLVKQWLQQAGNEEIFYYHLSAWEARRLQFQPDLEKATSRYKQFLVGDQFVSASQVKTEIGRQVQFNWYKLAGVAASLLIVLTAGYFLARDFFLYTTYSTAYGMTQNILLEDGSEVTLNANSILKVPKDLVASQTREVWLQGEGFFHVAKRPDGIRFQVHTDNMDIEVLGTKFNVNNRRGNTEVVLDEGSVKLISPKYAAPVFMKPGDYVSLAIADSSFRKKVVRPEKYNAWQTNKLIFEDTPMRVVAEKIEDYYGVKIKIQNQDLALREVTGTLPNNDLGVVLKSLSTSHKLEIIREKDLIIFR
jgi:ferric-dicitrate binding protein FerR (iron transport regulator)